MQAITREDNRVLFSFVPNSSEPLLDGFPTGAKSESGEGFARAEFEENNNAQQKSSRKLLNSADSLEHILYSDDINEDTIEGITIGIILDEQYHSYTFKWITSYKGLVHGVQISQTGFYVSSQIDNNSIQRISNKAFLKTGLVYYAIADFASSIQHPAKIEAEFASQGVIYHASEYLMPIYQTAQVQEGKPSDNLFAQGINNEFYITSSLHPTILKIELPRSLLMSYEQRHLVRDDYQNVNMPTNYSSNLPRNNYQHIPFNQQAVIKLHLHGLELKALYLSIEQYKPILSPQISIQDENEKSTYAQDIEPQVIPFSSATNPNANGLMKIAESYIHLKPRGFDDKVTAKRAYDFDLRISNTNYQLPKLIEVLRQVYGLDNNGHSNELLKELFSGKIDSVYSQKESKSIKEIAKAEPLIEGQGNLDYISNQVNEMVSNFVGEYRLTSLTSTNLELKELVIEVDKDVAPRYSNPQKFLGETFVASYILAPRKSPNDFLSSGYLNEKPLSIDVPESEKVVIDNALKQLKESIYFLGGSDKFVVAYLKFDKKIGFDDRDVQLSRSFHDSYKNNPLFIFVDESTSRQTTNDQRQTTNDKPQASIGFNFDRALYSQNSDNRRVDLQGSPKAVEPQPKYSDPSMDVPFSEIKFGNIVDVNPIKYLQDTNMISHTTTQYVDNPIHALSKIVDIHAQHSKVIGVDAPQVKKLVIGFDDFSIKEKVLGSYGQNSIKQIGVLHLLYSDTDGKAEQEKIPFDKISVLAYTSSNFDLLVIADILYSGGQKNIADRLSYHQSLTGGMTNPEKMRGDRASDTSLRARSPARVQDEQASRWSLTSGVTEHLGIYTQQGKAIGFDALQVRELASDSGHRNLKVPYRHTQPNATELQDSVQGIKIYSQPQNKSEQNSSLNESNYQLGVMPTQVLTSIQPIPSIPQPSYGYEPLIQKIGTLPTNTNYVPVTSKPGLSSYLLESADKSDMSVNLDLKHLGELYNALTKYDILSQKSFLVTFLVADTGSHKSFSGETLVSDYNSNDSKQKIITTQSNIVSAQAYDTMRVYDTKKPTYDATPTNLEPLTNKTELKNEPFSARQMPVYRSDAVVDLPLAELGRLYEGMVSLNVFSDIGRDERVIKDFSVALSDEGLNIRNSLDIRNILRSIDTVSMDFSSSYDGSTSSQNPNTKIENIQQSIDVEAQTSNYSQKQNGLEAPFTYLEKADLNERGFGFRKAEYLQGLLGKVSVLDRKPIQKNNDFETKKEDGLKEKIDETKKNERQIDERHYNRCAPLEKLVHDQEGNVYYESGGKVEYIRYISTYTKPEEHIQRSGTITLNNLVVYDNINGKLKHVANVDGWEVDANSDINFLHEKYSDKLKLSIRVYEDTVAKDKEGRALLNRGIIVDWIDIEESYQALDKLAESLGIEKLAVRNSESAIEYMHKHKIGYTFHKGANDGEPEFTHEGDNPLATGDGNGKSNMKLYLQSFKNHIKSANNQNNYQNQDQLKKKVDLNQLN